MSKELTPLEALNELFDIAYDKVRSGWEDKPLERKLLVLNDIIEKALKQVDDLKFQNHELRKKYELWQNTANGLGDKLVKQDKILEIIKEYIVNISFKYGGKMGNVIKLQIGCDTCYLHFDENDKNFELLKEVLK